MATLAQAREAKQAAIAALSRLAPVVGVGITKTGNAYGLKVNLESAPPAGSVVPKLINRVPVRVEVVGKIKKQIA